MGKIGSYSATVIIPVLFCVVVTMNATTPGEFYALRLCIWAVGIGVFILIGQILYFESYALWHTLLGAAVMATVVISVPSLLRWVDAKEVASKQLPRMRAAFSATESIKLWAPSLGGNETLDLDNVAILRVVGPAASNQITLALDTVPVRLKDMEIPGKIKIESPQFQIRDPSKEYPFDGDKNKRHEIEIGGRTFIVVLKDIFPRTIEGVADPTEYVFGISER